MSRGARPGERRGGRGKGSLNKATIERALVAERIVNEATLNGRRLAKEVLQDFVELFTGLAAAHQPTGTSPGELTLWKADGREPYFEKYARLAVATAKDLAQYQSPKLAAVQVVAPAPNADPVRKRFSVSIFDHSGRPLPKAIEVTKLATAKLRHSPHDE
ncbi:hypothetical protein [Bradyrhizobium septentrionale]|uniref:Uncharacterized protein n=1 Tax=Bradyrhizobium septentrionale TaxID=1404411 RepID=A0A974A5C7_9BRAD|nr:hypothetical protein [Bradyrhizobium septentrionale]UGY17895.1 hypothetical protein HAP48_0010940 [Bradyrhizobium septentrionale]UGY26631.1 hypothetical protein HU675_0007650 [Bradyrhizobium septentrionale]